VQESYWVVEGTLQFSSAVVIIKDSQWLVISLEKANEDIWGSIIKGDQEIDTSKVDNSKRLNEFDGETQGALRKIVYEQDRKMRGLPTTEEEQQRELLRRAWDAEGSPFKGTPFDPSQLNNGLQFPTR